MLKAVDKTKHLKQEIEVGNNNGHDHANMMAGPKAAEEFLKKFYIVTAFLVPLVFLSNLGINFLGVPDFGLRQYLEFGIATVIFYFGLVFFRHAKQEIKSGQYGMMTLVSLGVGSGYLFSTLSTFVPVLAGEFYLEVSSLIWVLLFGHFLEARSSMAAGNALQEVAKLLPKQANLKTKEGVEKVDPTALKKGDIVIVKPGEKVPADGKIIKGRSNFNESHLTGEFKPLEKEVGDQVIAGAISIGGSVEVKLSRVGKSSTVGQIKDLISKAEQTKPSAQRLADRAARWLTFSALGISILALLIWTLIVGQTFVFGLTLAITVLVIACPHALGLAIPTVSTIATRLAVKNGLFIKDMSKIEVIKDAEYVVFDKTGTLTTGEFGVTDVKLFSGTKDKLFQVAGSIEEHSTHVIGLALLGYLKDEEVDFPSAEKIKNLAGRGIAGMVKGKKYFLGNKQLMVEKDVWEDQAEEVFQDFSEKGKTLVFVADEENILGVFGLSDQVKEDSKSAVNNLHDLGIKVAMLTGDTEKAAKPIAETLGIDKVFAQVLPEEKYKYVRRLQEEGNTVLMTGDGVNDGPALTQADAGIALGAGTDVAVEAGDIVLTQNNPLDVVRLINLSNKAYRKMVENLFWALGYNVLALPAAAGLFIPFGFRLSPALGAILMSLSSVVVVINALSLRKAKL